MKKICKFTVFLLLCVAVSAGPASAVKITECSGWACIQTNGQQDEKDFFTTVRNGGKNTWELAIWDGGDGAGESVEAQANYDVPVVDPTFFGVSYDPTDGEVTLAVKGAVQSSSLSWTYDFGKAFEYIAILAKGNSNKNGTFLTDMELNGNSLPDVSAPDSYQGLQIFLDDSEQQNGFSLTGMLEFTIGLSPKDEIPGFHVFAMNTHDLAAPVPEPATMLLLGTGLLGLAGFGRKKFKK